MGSASIQITSTNPWPDSGPRSSTDTIQIGSVQSSNAGLVATYYSDTWLGTPVATQIDSTINFDGSGGSPAPGVGSTNWSARWDGLIQIPQTGTYTFYTTTGGGCRLWVNNQLLIDNWDPQAAATTFRHDQLDSRTTILDPHGIPPVRRNGFGEPGMVRRRPARTGDPAERSGSGRRAFTPGSIAGLLLAGRTDHRTRILRWFSTPPTATRSPSATWMRSPACCRSRLPRPTARLRLAASPG